MTVAIAVDWSGPFPSIDEARKATKQNQLGEVIYFALGRCGRQHQTYMQYVGISGDGKTWMTRTHHKLGKINKEGLALWVGEVVSHAVSGRRAYKLSTMVNLAEGALAYFLELPLNDRKRRKPPPRSLILINRWFQCDFDTRRVHRPHDDWPDFIEYEHPTEGDGGAVIVWFGSRRERLSESDVRGLAKPPVQRPVLTG